MTATPTKSRGIIFSGPMVRALLEGRKNQTRRVITEAIRSRRKDGVLLVPELLTPEGFGGVGHACRRYGVPGDELWVRETWQHVYRRYDGQCFTDPPNAACQHSFEYLATVQDGQHPPRWRSPIHMPRSASRITLRISSIRVERLTSISTKDVLAEGFDQGVDEGDYMAARAAFKETWDKLHNKPGERWSDNPWVWVISFSIRGKDARPAANQQ